MHFSSIMNGLAITSHMHKQVGFQQPPAAVCMPVPTSVALSDKQYPDLTSLICFPCF